MIEVNGSKELVPENDLQELWKLAGRVEAVKGFLCRCIVNGTHEVDTMTIYEMLCE